MLTKPTKALARAVRLAAAPPILRPDGPLLDFSESCKGVVTDRSTQRVSDMHTTGNLGWHSWRTGLMLLPSVRTTIDHYQEFWVEDEDGPHRFELINRPDIAVGRGNRIGVLVVNAQIAYVKNYSAREQWWRVTTLEHLLPQYAPMGFLEILGVSLLLVPAAILFLDFIASEIAGDAYEHFGWQYNHSLPWFIIDRLAAVSLFALPVVFLIRLFLRQYREKRANAQRWQQGLRELDAACRSGLDIDPQL